MSGRLFCYKQQQHSKLLAQFVSAFRFNTCTKTCAPLPDCRINNALIQFVQSCQDTRTQFIDVLDPPFTDIACNIISCLVMANFVPKNSIVTKFCYLMLGGLGIMPHRVGMVQLIMHFFLWSPVTLFLVISLLLSVCKQCISTSL